MSQLCFNRTQIVFEAVRGGGYRSDIALDEIRLIPGICGAAAQPLETTTPMPPTTRTIPLKSIEGKLQKLWHLLCSTLHSTSPPKRPHCMKRTFFRNDLIALKFNALYLNYKKIIINKAVTVVKEKKADMQRSLLTKWQLVTSFRNFCEQSSLTRMISILQSK